MHTSPERLIFNKNQNFAFFNSGKIAMALASGSSGLDYQMTDGGVWDPVNLDLDVTRNNLWYHPSHGQVVNANPLGLG